MTFQTVESVPDRRRLPWGFLGSCFGGKSEEAPFTNRDVHVIEGSTILKCGVGSLRYKSREFGMTCGPRGVIHWKDGGEHKGHFRLRDILEFKPGEMKGEWQYFRIVTQEPDTNSLKPYRSYDLCSKPEVYDQWKGLIETYKCDTSQDWYKQQNVVLALINDFEKMHEIPRIVKTGTGSLLDEIGRAIVDPRLTGSGHREKLAETALAAYGKVIDSTNYVWGLLSSGPDTSAIERLEKLEKSGLEKLERY